MTQLSLIEVILLRLSNWISEPADRDWIAAMAVETTEVRTNRLDWAAGCLLAAIRTKWENQWPRLLLAMASPLLVVVLNALTFGFAATFAGGLLRQELFLLIVMLTPVFCVAVLIGFVAVHQFPLGSTIIAATGNVLFPLMMYWILTSGNPVALLHSEASWLSLTPVLGITAQTFVLASGAYIGRRLRKLNWTSAKST